MVNGKELEFEQKYKANLPSLNDKLDKNSTLPTL